MINLFGTAIRTILAYAYAILLARMLTVSDLGKYFLILTLVNIFGLAATVGLDLGVVRYVSLFVGIGERRRARRVFFLAILIGMPIAIAVTSLVVLLAPVISQSLLDSNSQATAALRIFALAIPFWMAARLCNATTQGLHRMKYQVYSRDIGEQFSKFVFSILVLLLGGGLVGIVWANLSSLAVAMLMSLAFVFMILPKPESGRRNGPITGEQTAPGSPSTTARLFRYSFPLAFSSLLGMVLAWMDLLLHGYLRNSVDAGYYGAVLRVGVISSAIFLAFATVFAPVISDLYNRQKSGQLQSLFHTVTRWIFICTLPIVLLQLLFADSILVLFGSEFTAGSAALMILALSQLVNAAAGPAGPMVLMSGHSKLELLNISASLLANVIFCFLLIPLYGLIGAAVANLVATILINTMRGLQVWIFLQMHAYDLDYLKPLAAGITAAGLIAITGRLVIGQGGAFQVAFLAVGMIVIYIASTVGLGLNSNDRTIIALVKKRLLTGGEVQEV